MASSTEGRSYIFLTRTGVWFSIGLILLFLMAASYDNNFVYLLLFMLTFLFLLSMVMTHGNLQRLELLKMNTTPAEEGKEVSIEIFLKNSGRDNAFQIQAMCLMEGGGRISGSLPLCSKMETTALRLKSPAGKPGVYQVYATKFETVYPLGLFRAWTYDSKTTTSLHVYPKPHNHMISANFYQHGLLTSEPQKEIETKSVAGDELRDHKPYAPGDSLTRVNWPLYSRGGPLLIKNFQESTPPLPLWHESQLLKQLGIKKTYEQLAYFLFSAYRQKQPFRLKKLEGTTLSVDSPSTLTQALRWLAERVHTPNSTPESSSHQPNPSQEAKHELST